MAGPSVKTIKRLFAVSGNQCAFPKCTAALVDAPSGKVTGRLCHIKGRMPGAKRYDASQSDADRHSYDNLLLLCPAHHDVIDDDEVAYTVDRLSQMKRTHESSVCETQPISDGVAERLILSIENNVLQNGSIIVTQNQLGGQVAHWIINLAPQLRRLSEASQNEIAKQLRQFPANSYEIETNSDDADGRNFGNQLAAALSMANWSCRGLVSSIFPGPIFGITVSYPSRTRAVSTLIECLQESRQTVAEDHQPTLHFVHILVGYRPELA